jgi:molybdate transport system regulatory protein
MTGEAERDPQALTIHSKIWIERPGAVALSEWRVSLLEAIDAHGSLTRAAQALDIPYRTTWNRVKECEAQLGMPLLKTESGADGGGSVLTPEARDLCERFRRIADGIHEVIADRFSTKFDTLRASRDATRRS